MKRRSRALGPALAALLGGCGLGGAPHTLTPQPTAVTDFHASIFNACAADVTLLVGPTQERGRKVLLFAQSRDSVAGGADAIWLLDPQERPIALYQPIQGKQRLQVTPDCTGLVRQP